MLRNFFTLLLLVLFVWVCFPLITPVAMGGVFALLFYPWFEKLESRRVPSSAAAGLITLAFSGLVLLPIFVLVVTGLKAAAGEFRVLQQQWSALPAGSVDDGGWMGHLAHHPAVLSWVQKLSKFFPLSAEELIATASDVLKVIGVKVGQGLGGLAARVPGMLMALLVAIVSLYFFLVDGKKLTSFVRRNSFFNPSQTTELLDTLGTMARSVVLASVLSGAAQSLVILVGMIISGAPDAGMVVLLVFLASFIPLVGSAPVTLGIVLLALVDGRGDQAIVLGISAVLASLIDNFVRPWVLKGGANMHPLLGFVAAFGGLQVFGLSGLFLGPITVGLFLAVLRVNLRSS